MESISLEKFDEVFNKLINKSQKAFILIISEADENGIYWCPDSEKVLPIYSELEVEVEKTGLPFYKFLAGDRTTWKNPDHVFRKNPALEAKRLPTFGLFNGARLVNTLTEGDILDREQRKLVYEAAK